jgi:hypothetical protein
MRLRHERPWHWRAFHPHADVRCARCGLTIGRRASASPFYGSAGPVGPTEMARMRGDSCSCVQPDPVVPDATGVTTA